MLINKIKNPLLLAIMLLTLAACGSSSDSSNSSSSVISSSVSSVSSVSSSVESSVSSESEASSSSTAATVITIDMTTGWRGNSTGENVNSGITYDNGVVFTASGDGVGAVFDYTKPTQLENAVIEIVFNASNEFKTSGANLQIYAQVKETWAGEWDCWTSNDSFTAGADATASCTISEGGIFNQSANDVQIGIQAVGSPNGVVTLKSAQITLAAPASSSSSSGSVYSANVDNLRDLANFPIGAAVTNNDGPSFNILTNTSEQAIVEKHFDQMTAGNIMKVSYLHPNNDTGTIADYDFTNADAFVDYANSKNMTVHGHALIWHADYQVPGFMKNWAGSSTDFLNMIDTHVTTIVDHFEAKGNVHSWDVVNEALDDNSPSNFRTNSAFYIKSGNSAEYIERAFQAARAADSDAILYYNDYNIDQNNAKTTKLVEMITDFQARNIPIDGVGFQMHIFMDYPSIANIKAAMKKVADKGLKVKITELDIAVNNPYSSGWSVTNPTQFTEATALTQKKRYCEVVAAYMDTSVIPVNQRGGVTVWGTTDANTWLTTATAQYQGQALAWPLLFDSNYNDKPALRGFADGLLGNPCTDQ